jgi:hypothetical protein
VSRTIEQAPSARRQKPKEKILMTLFIPPPSAGNPIWANDHIWLDIQGGPQGTGEAEGTNPAPPPAPQDQGTLNNVIGVTVERHDNGNDPNLVTVQAFVCNPSVGVGVSNGNLATAGGQAGHQDYFLPNTNFGTTPPPAAHIDWYPLSSEVNINGGHICIAANVYDAAGDGAALVAGAFNLSDEHMAQRNIGIEVAPGPRAPMRFSFYVPEAELMPAGEKEVQIRVQPVPREQVLTPVIREQLLASTTVTLAGGEPTPEAGRPGPYLNEPRERIRLRGGGELVLARGKVPIHPAKYPLPEVVLVNQEQPEGSTHPIRVVPRPGRRLPITAQLKISPDAEPGGVHEFDIICEGGGGVTGGLRVVVLTDAS